MLKWFTPKRSIRVGLVLLPWAVFAFVLAPGSPHAIHSAGAVALDVKTYQVAHPTNSSAARTTTYMTQEAIAGQSLDQVRCALWAQSPPRYGRTTGQTCDLSAVRSTIFPTVVQAPDTIYLAWIGCIDWSGHGPITPWEGFNLEYMPASRTVILHCYIGRPWFWIPERLFGEAGLPPPTLFAIGTASIGAGTLNFDEDDRVEHWLGDQSTVFRLTSAVVS